MEFHKSWLAIDFEWQFVFSLGCISFGIRGGVVNQCLQTKI